MSGDFSVNVDPALIAYLEDRIKGVFGRDAASERRSARLTRRMRLALEQARSVKCVGMDRPIAIQAIYQPIGLQTDFTERSHTRLDTDIHRLMAVRDSKTKELVGTDGIIYAGPGRGKSTLLNWLYVQLQRDSEYCPFLFILRTENAVSDLKDFVEHVVSKRLRTAKGHRPLLLVDGYDEVTEDERKVVSAALMEYRATGSGNFFLTCRTFYDVYDLKVANYWLSPFRREDVLRFVESFSQCYEVSIDPVSLVEQLEHRDLWECPRHPLMLTLICILKTGPLPELPHRSIDLLARAFDTLTFRWDQQRGIHRKPSVPLDSYDHIKILMRVAFKMRSLIVSRESIETFVRQYLALIQKPHIDARTVMQEIAQWYGVLVPTSEERWQFLHRSIHDYLAARFWLETGRFDPTKVKDWNYRAAYAACISGDATKSIVLALRTTENIQAFSECLYNKAPFIPEEAARAVLEHFERFRPFTHHRSRSWLTVESPQEFFGLASNQFLDALQTVAVAGRSPARDSSDLMRYEAHDVLAGYVLGEFRRRRLKVKDDYLVRQLHVAFDSSEFHLQLGIEKPVHFLLREVIG